MNEWNCSRLCYRGFIGPKSPKIATKTPKKPILHNRDLKRTRTWTAYWPRPTMVFADVLVRSPRRVFICHTQLNIIRVKGSQKEYIWVWTTITDCSAITNGTTHQLHWSLMAVLSSENSSAGTTAKPNHLLSQVKQTSSWIRILGLYRLNRIRISPHAGLYEPNHLLSRLKQTSCY